MDLYGHYLLFVANDEIEAQQILEKLEHLRK